MAKEITQREEQINATLRDNYPVIKSLFGDKKKADKFYATAIKVANDYKLKDCHPKSIVEACVTVAQLNLDLSPALSHAYIVPFKSKNGYTNAQLIISARGYQAILSRNGWDLKSFVVYEDDIFSYTMNNFDEKIVYERNIDSDNENFKYAVAMAKSPNGTIYIEVMNKKQIEKHRKVSQNQSGDEPTGIWLDWYNEMSLKTVVKKLVKKLPLGEEIAQAVYKDDKAIDVEVVEDKKTSTSTVNTNDIARTLGSMQQVVNSETGEVTTAAQQQDADFKL